jgi:hypothetical protein
LAGAARQKNTKSLLFEKLQIFLECFMGSMGIPVKEGEISFATAIPKEPK